MSRLFAGVPSSFPGPYHPNHPCFSPLPYPQIFRGSAATDSSCLLGDACPPPPPDQDDSEPPMLPPYGHDANPRSCSSPLRMLSASLDAAPSCCSISSSSDGHGRSSSRSGGALGHGTGPWESCNTSGIREDYHTTIKFIFDQSTYIHTYAFSKLLQAIPKSDLSTYVLCLMIYLMSYDLCLILCLMTYVLCLI